MILCQNKSKTEESIKEAKAPCAHSIREVQTNCVHSIKETEAHCSTAIREVEAQGASQASSIQQSHAKGIQHPEEEAIEEESKGQQISPHLPSCPGSQSSKILQHAASFLSSTTWTHTNISSFQHPPRGIPLPTRACPWGFVPFCPYCTWAFTQAQVTASLTRSNGYLASQQGHIQGNSQGAPSLKWQEIMPLCKVLMRSHQEAFGQDTHLVKKTWEEYFRNHCPNFDNENTHNLMDVFQCMIETASLLGSTIYKIQEAWTGWDELQHANYALRTLLKGLKFF